MPSAAQRKPIRLPAEAYRDPGSSWLVTLTTKGRTPHFADACLAGCILALLVDESPRAGVDMHVGCLMPDHAHLLMSVTTGDLVAAIGGLKSLSTRVWHGFGGNGALWQRSFHDQGLRTDAAFEEAVRYILQNPVVAGLADTWESFDFIAGTSIGR